MDDDLDTPAAMALLFDSVRKANAALDAGDLATAGPLAGAVRRDRARRWGSSCRATWTTCPAAVAALAAERDAARGAKDFSRADAIRDQLQADGWVVEDTGERHRSVRRS